MYKMSTPFQMDFSGHASHATAVVIDDVIIIGRRLLRKYIGRCLCKRVDVYIITLSTWRIYALSERLLVSVVFVCVCAEGRRVDIQYSNWLRPYHPLNDPGCAAVTRYGYWESTNCTELRPFVCQSQLHNQHCQKSHLTVFSLVLYAASANLTL